ncbi:hypothetical protein [Modestobacter lapidis]|nr:hypothetical protein [Modestobacter lapidis]
MGGRALGAGLVALLLAGCGAGGGAVAACVGPQVTLSPTEGPPGTPVTAEFEWLREGCNDYPGADEETAMVDVPVSFVQGGVEVPLGTVTGRGERWSATLQFTVPDESRPGGAGIRLHHADGAVPTGFTVLPPG